MFCFDNCGVIGILLNGFGVILFLLLLLGILFIKLVLKILVLSFLLLVVNRSKL